MMMIDAAIDDDLIGGDCGGGSDDSGIPLWRARDRQDMEFFLCTNSVNFHSSLLFHLSVIGKEGWVQFCE